MTRFIPFCFTALLSLVAIVGCGQRRDVATAHRSPFQKDESEYVAMIAIDTSSSFRKLMTEDGHAYAFILRVIDKYFRDRTGSDHDLLLLTQVSGTRKSILWQGNPASFRRQFGTKNAFRDFLVAEAGPDGSLVHDGIAHGLEHMMDFPNVASGKAKSVLLILSDLDDNGPNPAKSEKRLLNGLTSYLSKGGHCGFYYADQLKMRHWKQLLAAAGFPLVNVECKENNHPPLPDFE